MPTQAPPDPAKIEAYNTLGLLKIFLKGLLRWGIANGSNNGGVGHCSVNYNQTTEAPIDLNATYMVVQLNFRNRAGNSGTLHIGPTGDQFIALTSGESVTPVWTVPAKWYYNVSGGASTDVYEIWWTG